MRPRPGPLFCISKCTSHAGDVASLLCYLLHHVARHSMAAVGSMGSLDRRHHYSRYDRPRCWHHKIVALDCTFAMNAGSALTVRAHRPQTPRVGSEACGFPGPQASKFELVSTSAPLRDQRHGIDFDRQGRGHGLDGSGLGSRRGAARSRRDGRLGQKEIRSPLRAAPQEQAAPVHPGR